VESCQYSPDVSFAGEDTVQESLWRHPFDGQHRLASFLVVVISGGGGWDWLVLVVGG